MLLAVVETQNRKTISNWIQRKKELERQAKQKYFEVKKAKLEFENA